MNGGGTTHLERSAALWASLRQGAADRTISPWRELAEMAYLWVRNGIDPVSYFDFGLHRREIDWPEKKNFASKEWYHRKVELINPASRRIVAWHKIVSHGLLTSFGVPTPRFYGFVSPSNGQTFDGHALCCAGDLADLVRRASIHEACFKLVGSWSGRGFLKARFHGKEDAVAIVSQSRGSRVSYEELWRDYLVVEGTTVQDAPKAGFGYLCQALVRQHSVLDNLHADSLNTARVWMYQERAGCWEPFAAVLRMGTGVSLVDNGAGGGIGAPIDLESGRLGDAVRRGRIGVNFQTYSSHPTSGATIRGVALPMWDQVVPLCRRACAAFPFFRLLGLDVAFEPGRPTIIEVEADPHSSHQAHFGKGVRDLIQRLVHAGRTMPLR